MNILASMYITLMPTIFSGIGNMLLCKSDWFLWLDIPIDRGLILSDGQRLLGGNKTYRGFLGMTVLTMIFTVIWGGISATIPFLETHNFFYIYNNNTFFFNLYIGFLLGFTYVLFELPNSFLKRRLHIEPGKTKDGSLAWFFIFFDQADSNVGMELVVAFFYPMSFWFYLFYVFLGAGTHLLINLILYASKVRKNIF